MILKHLQGTYQSPRVRLYVLFSQNIWRILPQIYYAICLQNYYCRIYVLIFFNYGILKNLKLGDNVKN